MAHFLKILEKLSSPRPGFIVFQAISTQIETEAEAESETEAQATLHDFLFVLDPGKRSPKSPS